MSRYLYPTNQNNNDSLQPSSKQWATEEELETIRITLDTLDDNLGDLQNALNNYKSANLSGITTGTLNAQNISALNGTINNVLQAAEMISNHLATNTLSAQGLAALSTVLADSLSVTNQITADSISSGSININRATITDLDAVNANITNWIITNLNVNNATIDTATVNDATLNTTTINNAVITDATLDNASIDAATITDGTIVNGNITNSNIMSLATSDIHWREYQAYVDNDIFYIEVPHFENGHYFIKATDSTDTDTFFTIEIYNSVDNYFIRWSQDELNWIQYCYTYRTGESAQLWFKIQNISSNPLKLYYANISSTSENTIRTWETLQITPTDTYQITYKNGNKFFKPIDLFNTGSTVGTLTLTTSSVYNGTDETSTSYDTTENVVRRDYKPDQSLNTTDRVKFLEVTSPFLGVSELDVAKKLQSTNIYNGPALSNTSTLPNNTLYIPNNVSSGNTIPAIKVLGNGNEVAYWSDNLVDAIDGKTFLTKNYKPVDGYTLDDSALTENEWTPPTPTVWDRMENGFSIFQSRTTGIIYVVLSTEYYTKNYNFYPISAISVDNNGQVVLNTSSDYINYSNNSSMCAFTEYPNTSGFSYSSDTAVEGQIYYCRNILGVDDTYTCIYTNIKLYGTSSIPYTVLSGDGAVIYRKSSYGTVPLVPYEEDNNIDDTHPLVYDSTNDILVKSDGDITVEGTLTVNDDTTINGDLSATGDLSITNNVSIGGTTTINGDLFVNGTTHTVNQEELTATGDIITLRENNPNGLATGAVSGITIHKYDGTSDLNLVTDNDGTLRVGTGTGTDTTYSNIALKSSDSQWYSYVDDTYTILSPQPSGTLTEYTGKAEVTGYTKYTTTTFTVIDKTSLVPLLGRDEDANLDDTALLKWDVDTWTAKTIAAPTMNNTYLKADVVTAYNGTHLVAVENDTTIILTGTVPTGATIGSSMDLATPLYYDNDEWYVDTTEDNVAKILTFSDTSPYYTTDGVDIPKTSIDTSNEYSLKLATYTRAASKSYSWGSGGGVGVAFIGTRAAYNTAKLIPEGQDGFIPSGALVIITDETDYLEGEEQ